MSLNENKKEQYDISYTERLSLSQVELDEEQQVENHKHHTLEIPTTVGSKGNLKSPSATYINSKHPRTEQNELQIVYSTVKQRVSGKQLLRSKIRNTFRRNKKKKSKKDKVLDEIVDNEVRMTEHQVPMVDLLVQYEVPNFDSGLTQAEADKRLETYGSNALTPPKQTTKFEILMREFFSPFAIVLWLSSLLCFIAFGVSFSSETELGEEEMSTETGYENLIVGITLVLVVTITALFGFLQTVKSGDAMKGFQSMSAQTCTVMRDGEKRVIDASSLVPGDKIYVVAGDKIPADFRIIECANMKVDNVSFTGESEPQNRKPECTHDNPLETANLAFAGSSIVEGSGYGIVIFTGDKTVIGQLAALVSSTGDNETPMMVEINNFVKAIVIFAAVLAIIFLVVGLVRDGSDSWSSLIVIIIGLVVGTVPEGLPSAIATSLALAANKMAKKNVLVTEQLSIVETLGRTTIIASDKTGTLTQNRMTVSHIWMDLNLSKAKDLYNTNPTSRSGSAFNDLYNVGTLCSRSDFEADQDDVPILDKTVIGDASETAVLKFCESVYGVDSCRASYPKVSEIPFNSTNKFQVSIHVNGDPETSKYYSYLLVLKGAPERVFGRCNKININGKVLNIDEDIKSKYDEVYMHIGSLGERVLGFSYLPLPASEFPLGFEFDSEQANFPLENLIFVGLMSMIDPPRESVPNAIAKCHEAGIKVAMVTGDHPITAQAIARQIGLLTPNGEEEGRAIVIHGEKLLKMSESELDDALGYDEIVFARTSPAQKLRIVEGLQRAGHVVAVTGDGVNDSPALKRANIGVAMGIAGTDVSKDASDIILLDDNFGSIVNGIAEGRTIFDNMKKSIAYTLSSKAPQLIPFILSFFMQLPPPLNALLILSIDIGTDLLPAISLAYEPKEADVMKRKPRGDSSRDKLVTVASIIYSYVFLGFVTCAAGFAAFFTIFVTGDNSSIVSGGYWSASSIWFSNGDDFLNSSEIMYDSNGLPWTQEQRFDLSKAATTAYFVTVLIVRMFVLMTTKTSTKSVFTHGLFCNKILNIGFIEILFMAVLLSLTPGIQYVMGTYMFRAWYVWFMALPFGCLIVGIDELRKYYLRTNVWAAEHLRY